MTACMEWVGATSNSGYGRRRIRGRSYSAHRVAYERAYGSIPEGMVVMHSCDNKLCVNPDHLSVGTQSENILDSIRKGRTPVGEDRPESKLTNDQVISIRKDTGLQKDIAKKHGITQAMVSLITTRQKWRHI